MVSITHSVDIFESSIEAHLHFDKLLREQTKTPLILELESSICSLSEMNSAEKTQMSSKADKDCVTIMALLSSNLSKIASQGVGK